MKEATQSPTYRLFVEAMIDEKPIRCMYGEHVRDVHPIILGYNKTGEEVALNYQFSGETSTHLRDWKCFYLSKVYDGKLQDGPSPKVPTTGGRNSCVDAVDLDVNPLSPYNPKRSLTALRKARKARRKS